MKMSPRLLNYSHTDSLPHELFSDLQLDKVLSTQAISVLQQPCGEREILRRAELFGILENAENLNRIEMALSVLSAAERSLYLLNGAKVPLDRYNRYAEVLVDYVNSCEYLISMSDLGSLFAEVSEYFSSEDNQRMVADAKKSAQRIKSLLTQMNVGLLSFSDKNWLTPNYEAISEFDSISEYAQKLGFSTPPKKLPDAKINRSMSDAICLLYEKEVDKIEAQLSEFSNVDFYEPLTYIPEIKFFLEIHNLLLRTCKMGIPHCTPTIAKEPQYIAKELHDISLLAKNCEHIVPNDAEFTKDEPFCFLLGANGGGKTTYLRAIGINLILFLSGCPIFAKSAEIFPFDIVLSHFPKDERFESIGRLDEEQKRAGEMLKTASDKTSFLLFNETYSGTDDKRGFDLLKNTAEQIRQGRHWGLYVTHFHEVISLDYTVLSAQIDPTDENKRTFRIVRSKGSASSYASDILKKYRLDKASLAARRDKYAN
ncbi:MAG: hypothetical protein E7589_05880 [Ruminococcaceae bacterium]|nr:hypothetical protein [Oscillospiraceae bacterium]